MPMIPVHTVESAPEQSRETLQALKKKTGGKLLNIYGEMGHSPVLLAAYTAMNEAIAEHGTFDARTKEAIALTVGAVNACRYCQSAHTMAAKAAGFTEAETIAIRRGEVDFDPKLAALLGVAAETATEVGYVDEATWQAALDAGWSDTELAEAYTYIGANLFTNYFNHYAGTDVDVPLAPGLE